MIADLLTRDGFAVQLGKGTKDDGIDIWATRRDSVLGDIHSIWQAKRLKRDAVEISVVRELAYTIQKYRASKGMIVTTTRLSGGAIREIELLGGLVGKKDHNDLLSWLKASYGLP